MNLRPTPKDSPDVNLTPLIDVVFLLLIFFMVSTTFDKETRLKVDLPEASTVNAEDTEQQQIAVTVDAAGRFYVNDREVINTDVSTLSRALTQAAQGSTDVPVIVTGDKHAPYQAFMTVMDAASQADLPRLRFVANQAKDVTP